jgi:hypothetical protein
MANANTSKHLTIVKNAVKRLRKNAKAQQEDTQLEPNKHLFYMLSNRASKKSIVHIGLKPGKTAVKVKNPNSIRNHLKVVVGDKKEEGLEKVLGKKDFDNLRDLNSCAGQVYMTNETLYFDITEKQGGGTPAELSKALKKLKPVKEYTIVINGDAEINKKEDVEIDTDVDISEKLNQFESLFSLPENGTEEEIMDAIYDAMEKSGISFGELDGFGGALNEDLRAHLDKINSDFDSNVETFEDRKESLLDMAAELAIDAWEIDLSGGERGIEAQSTALNDACLGKEDAETITLPDVEIELPSGEKIILPGKTLKKRGDKSAYEQIQDLIDGTEEALILLDFGDPEQLRKDLIESFNVNNATIEERTNLMDSIVESESNNTIEDGIKNNIIEESQIAMPIPSKVDERHKLLMVKLLTDENKHLVENLMSIVDVEIHSESGDSRKDPENIAIKAHRPDVVAGKEDWIGVEHIRDSFRFKSVVQNITDIPKIFKKLVETGIQLVKIDTEKLFNPKDGDKGWGWRIIAFDLRMPNGQIVEWYLPLKNMEIAKKKGHKIFEDWRTIPVKELEPNLKKLQTQLDADPGNESLIEEVVKAQKTFDDYVKAQNSSFTLYNDAFEEDVAEMGYASVGAMETKWKECEQTIQDLSKGAGK